MLARDTQSTCDTLTHNQHMKRTRVPEIETPHQNGEKDETIVVFSTKRLHQRKVLADKIRMCYFYGNKK